MWLGPCKLGGACVRSCLLPLLLPACLPGAAASAAVPPARLAHRGVTPQSPLPPASQAPSNGGDGARSPSAAQAAAHAAHGGAHDKSYAFVEFRSVEEASNAMALDGVNFRESYLKVCLGVGRGCGAGGSQNQLPLSGGAHLLDGVNFREGYLKMGAACVCGLYICVVWWYVGACGLMGVGLA